MPSDDLKFETKTVRAIRGTESRTIAKWEQEGWEVVGQSTGRLNSEITLRRPQPKKNWLLIGGVAAAVAAFIVFALIMAALEGPETDAVSEAESTVSQTASPVGNPTTEPSQPATTAADVPAEIITVDNNAEFAALLELNENCGADVAKFAEAYAGRTISFDASIDYLTPHDGYETRFDFLVTRGDYSLTESGGPNFQFRDFNYYDLNLTGENIPDEVRAGDNVRVTATINEFVEEQCLFLIEPVETVLR